MKTGYAQVLSFSAVGCTGRQTRRDHYSSGGWILQGNDGRLPAMTCR